MSKEINLSIPKNKKYLGDAIIKPSGDLVKDKFVGLPKGIIDKKYTGIGATTLELEAKRNSIIVFPYIKLAQEKAAKFPHYYFYLGSRTKTITDEEIQNYANDKSIKFKKFCVVANSIFRLYHALGKKVYKDYHLVLDEVEILQMQSEFREGLPECFEEFARYKSKTLISATLLPFKNKELRNLTKYVVEKEKFNKELLEIVNSIDPISYVADYVRNTIDQGYSHKFFIGINSSNHIKRLITLLNDKSLGGAYKILCSTNLQDEFPKNTEGEIDPQKHLPATINIATSAYYCGFDIEDEFEAIAVSLDNVNHFCFSFENLIQFYGRGRGRSILKKKLIIKLPFDTDKLVKSVNWQLLNKRSNDLQKFFNSIPKILKHPYDLEKVIGALTEIKTDNPKNLIYKNRDGYPAINYLLNDLHNYETNKVLDYQNGQEGLLEKLSERFIINLKDDFSSITELEITPTSTKENFIERLVELRDNPNKVYRVIKNQQKKQDLRALSFLFFLGVPLTSSKDELQKFFDDFLNLVKAEKQVKFSDLIYFQSVALNIYSSGLIKLIQEDLEKKALNGKFTGKDIHSTLEKYVPKDVNIRYLAANKKITYNETSLLFRLLFNYKKEGKTSSHQYSIIETKPPILISYKNFDKYLEQINNLFNVVGIIEADMDDKQCSYYKIFLNYNLLGRG